MWWENTRDSSLIWLSLKELKTKKVKEKIKHS